MFYEKAYYTAENVGMYEVERKRDPAQKQSRLRHYKAQPIIYKQRKQTKVEQQQANILYQADMI